MHNQCSIGIQHKHTPPTFIRLIKKMKNEKYKKSLFNLFHHTIQHTHIHIMSSILLHKIISKKKSLKKEIWKKKELARTSFMC